MRKVRLHISADEIGEDGILINSDRYEVNGEDMEMMIELDLDKIDLDNFAKPLLENIIHKFFICDRECTFHNLTK